MTLELVGLSMMHNHHLGWLIQGSLCMHITMTQVTIFSTLIKAHQKLLLEDHLAHNAVDRLQGEFKHLSQSLQTQRVVSLGISEDVCPQTLLLNLPAAAAQSGDINSTTFPQTEGGRPNLVRSDFNCSTFTNKSHAWGENNKTLSSIQ